MNLDNDEENAGLISRIPQSAAGAAYTPEEWELFYRFQQDGSLSQPAPPPPSQPDMGPAANTNPPTPTPLGSMAPPHLPYPPPMGYYYQNPPVTSPGASRSPRITSNRTHPYSSAPFNTEQVVRGITGRNRPDIAGTRPVVRRHPAEAFTPPRTRPLNNPVAISTPIANTNPPIADASGVSSTTPAQEKKMKILSAEEVKVRGTVKSKAIQELETYLVEKHAIPGRDVSSPLVSSAISSTEGAEFLDDRDVHDSATTFRSEFVKAGLSQAPFRYGLGKTRDSTAPSVADHERPVLEQLRVNDAHLKNPQGLKFFHMIMEEMVKEAWFRAQEGKESFGYKHYHLHKDDEVKGSISQSTVALAATICTWMVRSWPLRNHKFHSKEHLDTYNSYLKEIQELEDKGELNGQKLKAMRRQIVVDGLQNVSERPW